MKTDTNENKHKHKCKHKKMHKKSSLRKKLNKTTSTEWSQPKIDRIQFPGLIPLPKTYIPLPGKVFKIKLPPILKIKFPINLPHQVSIEFLHDACLPMLLALYV